VPALKPPTSCLQVCSVTCCGIINFKQHCTSKKHLRKAEQSMHKDSTCPEAVLLMFAGLQRHLLWDHQL